MVNYIRFLKKFVFLFVVCACVQLPAMLHAQVIKDIFIKGNLNTPTEAIAAKISSKTGEHVSREVVQKDVKDLYKLGHFLDIKVDEQEVAGGVTLTYIFVEKPTIAKISFKNNKALKEEKLKEEVVVPLYAPLDEKKLSETITKVKERYAKEGFYLADVDYELHTDEQGDVELIFDINENKKVAINKIRFVGNKVFNDKKLRKVMKTKQKDWLSFITSSGKYKSDLLDQDIMRLNFHYLTEGYLKVKIKEPVISLSKDKRYLFITFYVEEGKRYKFGDISVSGDVITTEQELTSMLSIKSGEYYNRMKLEQDVMALTNFYGDHGYAFADIRPITKSDDEKLLANMLIYVDKGSKITIERINITGNTTTRDKVVRRELKIKEGDLYNATALNESKSRLMQLGYFKEVNFSTPRGTTNDTLNLNIDVEEQPTGSFNIGAGFSSVENFIFNGSVSKQNFFGYGISGQVSAALSSRRQQFLLQMYDPYFLDSQWTLNVSAQKSMWRYTDFDRESYGGSVQIGHHIFDNCLVSLGYEIEEVSINDFSYTVPDIFKDNSSGLTSALNLMASRDTRNNRISPTKGLYNMVQTEVSGTKLGGDNDFFRITAKNQIFQPLFWHINLKAYNTIGYIESLNTTTVPLFERYFMGGPNNLRGFYPNSVGPTLRIAGSPEGADSDFVYGGNKYLLFVGELEIPLYEPAGFKFVFFMDAGNVFAEEESFSLTKLRTDYGFGLRWISPFGALRFEWGIPFSPNPGDSPVVFNFGIGEFF